MKKIGFLLGSLAGAGAEKTVLTLATKLSDRGHDVHLFVLKDVQDYKAESDLNIHIVQSDSSDLNQGLEKASHAAGELDLFVTSRAEFYDVVQAKKHFCSVHITPTAWLKKRSLPFRWKTYVQKLKLKKKFANKNLIALSEGIKSDLVENLGVDAKHVTVINNPFDIEKIHTEANAELTEAATLGDYIVYVAAMIPRKRHEDLFRAFSQIKKQDIKLVLVGKGLLKSQLEKLAKELGIEDRVVFWPWDPNPYRLIKNAKLSVLVSEAEGLPRVLIESIIIGTPVVSTDCPSGPNEVLINQNAKYLVPIGDVNKLSQIIDTVLEESSIQVFKTARFDALEVAKRYEALIDD